MTTTLPVKASTAWSEAWAAANKLVTRIPKGFLFAVHRVDTHYQFSETVYTRNPKRIARLTENHPEDQILAEVGLVQDNAEEIRAVGGYVERHPWGACFRIQVKDFEKEKQRRGFELSGAGVLTCEIFKRFPKCRFWMGRDEEALYVLAHDDLASLLPIGAAVLVSERIAATAQVALHHLQPGRYSILSVASFPIPRKPGDSDITFSALYSRIERSPA